ncbi:MAG: glycosyltransferase family 2 protein, partial [Bacteroidetes bacterium]|nr:glycosyltransferase family 2 protein [Bacteroidota bacterium]
MLMGKKIVVVLPAYNAEQTLEQTYKEVPMDIVDEVILVDDASSDKTVEVGRQLGIQHIISHEKNKGYGGNQKSCYNKALEIGPDSVIPNWAKEMLLLFQGESAQAKEYAGKVLRQDPGWTLSLANLRNQDLLAGLAADARARYEKQFPLLFDSDPEIDR